jgi:uncharacterized protein YjbI with pentapeptide repeats
MADETVSSNGEPDNKEAEAFVDALNHSAERVQTLWFSFLTFMLYLAIAAGTTTHRMLFLEEPLNLPVLNIKLPLLGFYILTPIIFVVFHFYMLLNLVLLARTARTFEDALARAFPEDGEARETFRMRIENTLFVQLLVGGRLEREGINAKLLSLMALISLALAPVALLLMFEVKFLPYHSEAITWLHRGLLALDLALVWTLWPGYRSGWGFRLWPKKTWWLVVPGIGSAVALAYAVMVATFPDERIYLATDWLHGESYWAIWAWELQWRDRPGWYDWIAFPNALDLHGQDLIDYARLENINKKNKSESGKSRWEPVLSLESRDFTAANLRNTDIRQVDFSGAILNRANFGFAWANYAHFECTDLNTFSSCTQLQGASIDNGQLQGASLFEAQLQGASLENAKLQGASLDNAQLQGASLDDAQLQGASLEGAQLQGASLEDAQLQGASLESAKLQGASLDNAQLQGASLKDAQLRAASFENAFVWRADARKAVWNDTHDTRVVHVKAGSKALCTGKPGNCSWTAGTFETLKKLIAEQIPEGEDRRAAMEVIDRRLDPNKELEGENEMAQVWADQEGFSPAQDAYKRSVAKQWSETGCAAEGAPYVLRGLLRRWDKPGLLPFGNDSPEVPKLAAAFLDKDCVGAHGLTEADKAKLKAIAAPAAPQAPNP